MQQILHWEEKSLNFTILLDFNLKKCINTNMEKNFKNITNNQAGTVNGPAIDYSRPQFCGDGGTIV